MIPDPNARHRDVTLVDGGTGSELRRRGVPLSPAAWSALAAESHYDLLVAIHADYIRAGADVITTSTFAGTRFVLDAAGRAADFERLNGLAVRAAHDARDRFGRSVAIAGSISCLPPAFDVARYPPPADEERSYRELAELLVAGEVDLLVLEMMQDTEHAARACAAARDSGLPFWLGVSCRLVDDTLVGYDLPQVTLERCLDALLPFAPAAVCVMHTPLDAVLPALAAVRRRFDGPIGAYPTIGDDAPGPVGPERFVAEARRWLDAGATIVGGCCGTTPAHIRALARALDA